MNAHQPAISVVIPTYNYAHLIASTLETVFAQTFTDYELIIVDDGSTDNTAEVVKPYLDRSTYFRQENQGLAAARNTGTRLAKGKYITYLDADDLWFPETLAVKYDVLRRYPELGGIFSDFLVFSSAGVSHPRGIREIYPFFRRTDLEFKDIFQETGKVGLPGGREVDIYRGRIFESLFFGSFILPTTMIMKRESVLETGDFRAHMRTQEDYEYWLRFSKRYPLAYVDAVLAQYRRHPQQLTDHSKIEPLIRAVLEIISQYEDEFSRNGKLFVFRRRKAELLTNLAKVHVQQGKLPQARKLYREAIHLDPVFWPGYAHYLLSFIPYSVLRSGRRLFR